MEDFKYKIKNLEIDINNLRLNKNNYISNKITADFNLSQLNKALKEFKDKENPGGYKDLLNRKEKALQLVKDLETKILDVNSLIKSKNIIKESLKKNIISINTNEEFYDMELKALRLKLVNLKNNYINFAADNSRISSKRQMAAEFVKELEKILIKE